MTRPGIEARVPRSVDAAVGWTMRVYRVLIGIVLGSLLSLSAPRAQLLTLKEVSEALATASPAHVADFAHRDLSYLDLSGLDFKRADLTGANLFGTDLSEANLSDVVAKGANLDHTVIIRANFAGADL